MFGVSISSLNVRRFELLRIYCQASAIAVAVLGLVILSGWTFHIEVLKSILPQSAAINPNLALLLTLSGMSLWLLFPAHARVPLHFTGRSLAIVVTLISAATRTEYLLGINLRVDRLLFGLPAGITATPPTGRMSPTSAGSFMAIGIGLLLLEWKTKSGRRPAQGLSLWPALVSLVAMTSHMYQATALTWLGLYTQIPLPMAIALFVLSCAVFFARPRNGITGDLIGDGAGSVMARRLLPAVFLIPLLLGWLCLQGQQLGLYGSALGLAIYSCSNVVFFGVLVWSNTRRMNVEHAHRSAAEAEIRTLNSDLERRVAERTYALEQQKAVLAEQAALLDLAHDAIVVHDMQDRIVFWNRGAEIMYGWPATQALDKTVSQLLKPELREAADTVNAQLLQHGHWEGDVTYQRRNGTKLLVNTHWTLQRNQDGTPVRIFGIYRDITERSQAASELQSLTERLSLATAVAKVGVWDWDLASNNLTWDGTMFEIYGAPFVATVPYEKWLRAIHPDDLPTVENNLWQIITNKGHGFTEYRIVRSDGAVRHVSLAARVVLNDDGAAIRVIGVNMDVTERKEAEEALRQSEARLSHSAQHDFLTGLPNRMLLNDRINQAIVFAPRTEKKVGVLFLDLDGFKYVNDSSRARHWRQAAAIRCEAARGMRTGHGYSKSPGRRRIRHPALGNGSIRRRGDHGEKNASGHRPSPHGRSA